jgi:hypothetical protein
MKLHELGLTEGEKAVIWHPLLGEILWNEVGGPGSGFYLSFKIDGELLIVDDVVLNDDKWEIVNER